MPPDYGLGVGFEPKHIDRKSLYTSLEERIKYLHHFLNFTAGMYPMALVPWSCIS